jgi:SAM-dependent methyltransferase
MQYEPVKKSLGRFISKSLFLRKVLYFLLDLLLLRTWHVKKAIRRLVKILPEEASVLDAGSGFGQYTWRMSSIRDKWKIKAIDINHEQIEECNEFIIKTGRSERIKFVSSDLTTLADINSYDLILTVDVMEHIKEDKLVFNNFHKALKEQGLLLISTPSDKGGSDVHKNNDSSFIEEHVRDGYGIDEITMKLKEAGFGNVKAQYTYGRAGNLSWLLSMKYPVKMLNKSFLFIFILPIYYLVLFPISVFLNIIDLYSGKKSGTGLLVLAEK